jgi:hypothetical protein
MWKSMDLLCAQAGRQAALKVPKGKKGLFAAASATLHQKGLYAMFQLLEKESSDVAGVLFGFLAKNIDAIRSEDGQDRNAGLADALADKLPELLHAKVLIERCLDYAHQHAKPLEAKAGGLPAHPEGRKESPPS